MEGKKKYSNTSSSRKIIFGRSDKKRMRELWRISCPLAILIFWVRKTSLFTIITSRNRIYWKKETFFEHTYYKKFAFVKVSFSLVLSYFFFLQFPELKGCFSFRVFIEFNWKLGFFFLRSIICKSTVTRRVIVFIVFFPSTSYKSTL